MYKYICRVDWAYLKRRSRCRAFVRKVREVHSDAAAVGAVWLNAFDHPCSSQTVPIDWWPKLEVKCSPQATNSAIFMVSGSDLDDNYYKRRTSLHWSELVPTDLAISINDADLCGCGRHLIVGQNSAVYACHPPKSMRFIEAAGIQVQQECKLKELKSLWQVVLIIIPQHN